MTTTPPRKGRERPDRPAPENGRKDRLKAALKANLARRKAQARARAAAPRDDGDKDDG